MKGLNTIIRFFGSTIMVSFYCLTASAQVEDSIAFQTDRDTAVKYVTPLEYAFMMHEETKFMLRVPVFGIGAELEILPYFTWMTQAYHPLFQMSSGTAFPDVNSEFRYYFGSRKLGVRNMSGNYFGAGVKIAHNIRYLLSSTSLGYYAKWGMQRRVLGNGLADIGIIAGFVSNIKEGTARSGFFIESPASLGLGFVFGKRSILDRNNLCSVVKCHEIESFLLKINFSNLINYYSLSVPDKDYHLLTLNPKISLEKKIFESPFSVNVETKLSFSDFKQSFSEKNYRSYSYLFEWSAGARWYYNMNRRMRLGKGGNGLSGNYISAGVGGYYYSSAIDGYHFSGRYMNSESTNWNKRLLPFISTGVQRTLGNRLYFDLGAGVSQRESNESGKFRIAMFADAQIGIKF